MCMKTNQLQRLFKTEHKLLESKMAAGRHSGFLVFDKEQSKKRVNAH